MRADYGLRKKGRKSVMRRGFGSARAGEGGGDLGEAARKASMRNGSEAGTVANLREKKRRVESDLRVANSRLSNPSLDGDG